MSDHQGQTECQAHCLALVLECEAEKFEEIDFSDKDHSPNFSLSTLHASTSMQADQACLDKGANTSVSPSSFYVLGFKGGDVPVNVSCYACPPH